MSFADLRIAVRPGEGLVARFDHTLLVIQKDTASAAASSLVEACRADPAPADRLRSLADSEDPEMPAFFALIEEGSHIHICVAGAMTVAVELEGSRLDFASADAKGWIEEAFRGELVALSVGANAEKAGTSLADLERGVVVGAGVEVVPRSAPGGPPPSATAPEHAEGETSSPDATVEMKMMPALTLAEAGLTGIEFERHETMVLMAPTLPGADTAPAPLGNLVPGRACAQGHLNDPMTQKCRVCGEALLETPIQGDRPPLGHLVAADGLSAVLDRDYLIGRGPGTAPEVRTGAISPLVVAPNQTTVSRVHAELRLRGWSVLVSDRSSANGTFVRPAGLDDWIRLDPGHAVQIVPGATIRLGSLEMRFEAES